MFIETFFFTLLLLLIGTLVPKIHFQLTKKKKAREKSGKWSGIEEIGVRALAQLRVLYSDRARSFYQ